MVSILVVLVLALTTPAVVIGQGGRPGVTARKCRASVSSGALPVYFVPFGRSQGDTVVPPNDNGNSDKVTLEVEFPFFGKTYRYLFVDTNGVVSFDTPCPAISPTVLPFRKVNRRTPMLAPYWADVDTTVNNGRVYFRQTTDPQILARVSDTVRRQDSWKYVMPKFRASWALVATWHNVTFNGGNCTTPVNTFQLVLLTNGRHSFVIYNYGDISWTSGYLDDGDAMGLGGNAALVGFASGGAANNYYVDGSLTPAVLRIDTAASNTDTPGQWLFRLEEATVQQWGCNVAGSLTIVGGSGPVLGGRPVQLLGPCLDMVASPDLVCRVDGVTVPAHRPPHSPGRVQCVPPRVATVGTARLDLSLDGGINYPFHALHDYVDADYDVIRVNASSWDTSLNLEVRWNSLALNSSYVTVEYVGFFMPNGSSGRVEEKGVILARFKAAKGQGSTRIKLGLPLITNMPRLSTFGAIRVYDLYKVKNVSSRRTLWSDPHWSLWFFNHYLIELVYRKKADIPVGLTDEARLIYRQVEPFFRGVASSRAEIARAISEGRLRQWTELYFTGLCNVWYREDQQDPADLRGLPPVPCTAVEAVADPHFTPCTRTSRCSPHPGSNLCARATKPTAGGHGQDGCYDSSGRLISDHKGSVSSGAAQRFHHVFWLDNLWMDARAHAYCCRWGNACHLYAKRRPSSDCQGYKSPFKGSKFYPTKPVVGGTGTATGLDPEVASAQDTLSLGRLAAWIFVGAVGGIIIAVLVAGLNWPRTHNRPSPLDKHKTKKKKRKNVKRKGKTSVLKRRKKPARSKEAKRRKKTIVQNGAVNGRPAAMHYEEERDPYYTEPRETSGGETTIRDSDTYMSARPRPPSVQDSARDYPPDDPRSSHFSNPLASMDVMYSEPRVSRYSDRSHESEMSQPRNRDSQMSEPRSYQSSKKSSHSNKANKRQRPDSGSDLYNAYGNYTGSYRPPTPPRSGMREEDVMF